MCLMNRQQEDSRVLQFQTTRVTCPNSLSTSSGTAILLCFRFSLGWLKKDDMCTLFQSLYESVDGKPANKSNVYSVRIVALVLNRTEGLSIDLPLVFQATSSVGSFCFWHGHKTAQQLRRHQPFWVILQSCELDRRLGKSDTNGNKATLDT